MRRIKLLAPLLSLLKTLVLEAEPNLSMKNIRELQGQDTARRMLERYLEQGPPPLLIFYGPDGVGKWSAAEAFVQQSFCETGVGCGVCAQCRKLQRGDHPDYIRFPEDRVQIGEAENPEPFTVRWLLRTRVQYTPFDAPMRFVLFPRADLILNEAETALLKTLEEPPDHTRFIMLVPDLAVLKQTIVSRGVCIPFQLLPRTVVAQLAGELPAEDRELLGGSLYLAPFLAGSLKNAMRERIRNALGHPKALADLERWIIQSERKNFADAGDAGDFSYLELLDVFALLLLQEAQKLESGRQATSRAALEFKGDLHRDMSGLHPYLLGRLFQRLDRALFAPLESTTARR